MHGRKGKSTFYIASERRSTVPEVEVELDDLPVLEPNLLDGEIVAFMAKKVLRHHAYKSEKGESGNLCCTNFRLCFVTPFSSGDDAHLNNNRHKFIGPDDIVLSNISAVYQISGDKSKKLSASKASTSPKQIHIHTKDVGIHCFSFEFADKKDRTHLVSAILIHAFPKRQDLLFAHEFSSRVVSSAANGHDAALSNGETRLVDQWRPNQYTSRHDWERELVRLGAKTSWRVTEINERSDVLPSMSEYFAVPTSIDDELLGSISHLLTRCRPPVWCYTHSNGGSLVSLITSDATNLAIEQRLVDAVKESHNQVLPSATTEPVILDLNKEICYVTDIQSSFSKMCSLCTPESVSDFYATDNTIYSQIDSAHWLRYVRSCLRISKEVSRKIRKGVCTIFIKEETPADLSCIVSCLVQIMLDNSCRTIRGLQNVIQRCWVAAGHPFCERLSILHAEDQTVTPVFLLFLDCLYQLTVQFPSSFEFSEIYLITLWDSCVTGLFKEFLSNGFTGGTSRRPESTNGNSSRVGTNAQTKSLISVWSWDIQYNPDFVSLFRNPLYEFVNIRQSDTGMSELPHPKVIKPNCHPSQVEVWVGCFYRNTAPMQIANGGKPAEYFQQCLLMEEITELQNQIAKLDSGATRTSGLYFNASLSAGGGMSSKLKSSFITSTYPFNNRISRNVSDISLCTLLQRSSVLSDSVSDDDP